MEEQKYMQQKKKRKILGIIAIFVVLAIVAVIVIGEVSKRNKNTIISVGSKAYTEQQILGNILADVIETNPNYDVEKKIGLGGTSICYEALKQGSIDMYVEYSAGIYLNQMALPFKQLNSDEIISTITPLLKNDGVELGPKLGYANDYEITVTKEFAEEKNLKTIEDLKSIQDEVVFAPTFEYVNRDDGMLGVNAIYGVEFKNVTPMEAGLRYSGLTSNEVQVINTFSTDGMKYKLDLVALEDPKGVHMCQDAVVIYNQKTFEKYPDLIETLKVLDNLITEEDMVKLNYQVDVEGETPEKVAEDFLREKGIIK